MDYNYRWEKIEELGKGGQGIVHLVRDKTAGRLKGDFQKELRSTLQDMTSTLRNMTSKATFEKPQRAELKKFQNAILDLVNPNGLAALKVLHDPEDARDPETAVERLKRELEALEKLSRHPSIVSIKDRDDDDKWYVSEFHANGTLAEPGNRERFEGDIDRSLRAFRTLVEAVKYLHDNDFVHRDIKPENIFVAADKERLILGDFGLVIETVDGKTRISGTDDNVGSWPWMPAWAQGRRIDEINPKFDVFSLGKTLWSMISGKDWLQLWYFDEPDNDLVKQFPIDDRMFLINKLLEKCIVQKEENCLENAGQLLDEIDLLATSLQAHPTRRCQNCGMGKYDRVARCINGKGSGLERFGLKPNDSTDLQILCCGVCGHTQLFAKPDPHAVYGRTKPEPYPWYSFE